MKIDLRNKNLISFDLKKYCEDKNIKLKNITWLDLSGNQLKTFELPKECENCIDIYLDYNSKLETVVIPNELKNIEEFWVNDDCKII